MDKGNLKYWDLSRKKFSDNITENELLELERWINESQDNKICYHDFKDIYFATADTHIPRFEPSKDWDSVQSLIAVQNEGRKWLVLSKTMKIAASLLLILCSIFVFKYFMSDNNNLDAYANITTSPDEKKEVLLPDGSTIWINRGSTILYPEEFNGVERTVYLKGEAYFEVKPDKTRPFVIYSGMSKTEVLGTSFNIRAYEDEEKVSLTVLTGKVKFASKDNLSDSVFLTAGKCAYLSDNSSEMVVEENTDKNFLSWKTEHLAFNNKTMKEVVQDVIRHYRVNITIQNPKLLDCHFTGDFNNTNIESVVNIITSATNSSYTHSEGIYFINGVGCK